MARIALCDGTIPARLTHFPNFLRVIQQKNASWP
jgi:hypothetical protein